MFLGQDFTSVGELTPSAMDAIFESETFKSWKKARDYGMKLPSILIARMDGMAKQLAGLHKALAAPRR